MVLRVVENRPARWARASPDLHEPLAAGLRNEICQVLDLEEEYGLVERRIVFDALLFEAQKTPAQSKLGMMGGSSSSTSSPRISQ